MKELQSVRETLIKQHDQELARTIKIKDQEMQRLKSLVNSLRDGSSDKVRTALSNEARDEARKAFDSERLKLLQEISELKSTKKQVDESLSNMIQADKIKAGNLRSEHHSHQEAIAKIKWESEKDIRRLVSSVEFGSMTATNVSLTNKCVCFPLSIQVVVTLTSIESDMILLVKSDGRFSESGYLFY